MSIHSVFSYAATESVLYFITRCFYLEASSLDTNEGVFFYLLITQICVFEVGCIQGYDRLYRV